MEDIDFWEDFVVENSNKLQNLGLEGKISWALNVFTLGPTMEARLVKINKEQVNTGWNQMAATQEG